VVGGVAASLVVALVTTLLMTPQYTSSARVKIDRIQAKVSDVQGVAPETEALDYLEFYSTQYALLESTSLAERVGRRLNLAADEEFLEAFKLDDAEELGNSS